MKHVPANKFKAATGQWVQTAESYALWELQEMKAFIVIFKVAK